MVYCDDFGQLEAVGRCSVGNTLEEEDMEDREEEDMEERLADMEERVVKKMLDYLSPYVGS